MFYGGCIAMACRDADVQPYQFDPESDQEGEGLQLSLQTLGHCSLRLCLQSACFQIFYCDNQAPS